ncbi:MAG: alpha/beta hydrolase [Candidatus Moraniibacteriota bacterium]
MMREKIELPKEKKSEIKIEKRCAGDGEIEIMVGSPDPEKLKSDTPVFIAPGWGNTAETLKSSLGVLAERGRESYTLDYPRKKQLDSISEIATEELQKAVSILATLRQEGIKKTDAVGYSEGGINLAVAASMEPDKFRNIVFVAPGGMVGQDSSLKLAGRFSLGALIDTLNTMVKPETVLPALKYTKELLKYIGKNPAMAMREVGAIAQSDITELCKQLKEKGIGISFVCGVDDKAFPMERVQKQANTEMLDGFYSVKGGHGELVLHPEKYTSLVEEALSALEKKAEKSTAAKESN